jgi:SAM-dependent methyltransferase
MPGAKPFDRKSPQIHTAGMSEADKWSEWVLDRGHGGQDEDERADFAYLLPIRDRVLGNARVSAGEVLLDVGAGDGLIAFEAARRLAPSGSVVFSDLSTALVEHARDLARARGLDAIMRFERAVAEDLSPVESGSVDVVTTRSVLIYVEDKARAFREFHRVLRSGGRISLFEPINRYFEERPDDFWGFDASAVRDLVEKLWAYEGWIGEAAEQAHQSDPMMNFGEGDLYRFAVRAGFPEVRVELVLERAPGSWVRDWDTLLATAPNPNAHTVAELLGAALSPEERERFEAHMRPIVERGSGMKESAFAYVTAVKA